MRCSFIRTWALVGSLALVASACSESSAPFENTPGDPTALFGASEPFNGTGACMGNDAYESGLTVGMSSPSSLNCTANDIYLARAVATEQCADAAGNGCVAIPAGTDITCSAGETVYVRVVADIGQSANSTRHDIGAWINPAAAQAMVGNTCNQYNLVVGSAGTVNSDGDQCADMAEGAETQVDLGVLGVACTPGPNNKVLLGSCLSWTQPGGDRVCPVAGNPDGANGFRFGTVPQNKSKCNCEPFELNIFVPGTVTIRKETEGGDGTFQYTSATLGNFPITTVGNFGDKVFSNVAHGAHSVTETDPTLPWEFVSLECNASGDGTSVATVGRTANMTIASGGSVVCTYKNRKRAEITIKKITDPAEDPAVGSFEFSQDIDGTGNFSLGHNGTKTFSNIVPGVAKTVTELAPTGYELVDITCTGADTWSGTVATRVLSVTPDAGEEILCTFKNEALGRLIVTKETIGYPPGTLFDFTVKGLGPLSGVNLGSLASFSLGDGDSKNSGFVLKAGTYQVCEKDATAGNTASAELDGAGVVLYNPDAPGDDLGTRCYDVAIAKGQSRQIDFLNEAPPGGDARTIGYWRNWSSCSGGNQYAKAGAKGMATLDDHLPQTVGNLLVDTCDKGVKILSKRDLGGQNRANDAAYNLASQLLAYYLNISAGAGTCSAASNAATAGQALLVSINFTGVGQYLRPQNGANYTNANNYAAILDSYNNNTLCP